MQRGELIDSEFLDRLLAEDIGAGDLTSQAVVPETARVSAQIVARGAGVAAGLELAPALYSRLSSGVEVRLLVADGDELAPGDVLLELAGPARPLLAGERVLLNLLGRLCGIATLTRAYVRALGDAPVTLLDTRKTTPGLRALEKAAVAAGGGTNHRMGLFDAVLIKENHLLASGAKGDAARFRDAVRGAIERAPAGVEVQVEVETLEELRWAVEAGARSVLLDNMAPEVLREARRIAPDAVLEASGGIALETIGAVAQSGVDRISVGALTHSAPCLDLSLRVRELLHD